MPKAALTCIETYLYLSIAKSAGDFANDEQAPQRGWFCQLIEPTARSLDERAEHVRYILFKLCGSL